jgi:VWFA-related protein
VLVAVAAAANGKPALRLPQPQGTPAAAQGDMVKLWVVAFTGSRRLVQDLTQKDFRVFLDNREQQIAYFSPKVVEPLYLGLLIDASEYTLDEPDLPDWQSVSRFLRMLLGREDHAFVARFNEKAYLLSDWTDDTVVLDDALRRAFTTKPQGIGALSDAVYTVCEERFSGVTGRKALIVISNSPDQSLDHSAEETLKIADRTNTIIYPVLPWARRRRRPLFENLKVAQSLSNETGGAFYLVLRPKDFDESLMGIGIALTHLYAIGYVPRDTVQDGRYHTIKVKCVRRGVKLIVREGYYAPEG